MIPKQFYQQNSRRKINLHYHETNFGSLRAPWSSRCAGRTRRKLCKLFQQCVFRKQTTVYATVVNKTVWGEKSLHRLEFKTYCESDCVNSVSKCGFGFWRVRATRKEGNHYTNHKKAKKTFPHQTSSRRAAWCRRRNSRLHQTPIH